MGEGWEQRNAALPLTALEGMQLTAPRQFSRAFGKGAKLLVTTSIGNLQKTQEESAFCLAQQDRGHQDAVAEDSYPREVL